MPIGALFPKEHLDVAIVATGVDLACFDGGDDGATRLFEVEAIPKGAAAFVRADLAEGSSDGALVESEGRELADAWGVGDVPAAA